MPSPELDGPRERLRSLASLTTAGGLAVPPMVLGTAALGSPLPPPLGRRATAEAMRLFDRAFEAGWRAFDAARSYALGGTERALGSWLEESGVRQEVFLITKIGHPLPFQPNRLSPLLLERELDASLRALGVEQVDLLLLHRDHPAANLEELATFFSRIKERGAARFLGVSNWSFERIEALEQNGLRIDASSPQLSLAEWKAPIWSGSHAISGRRGRFERLRYEEAGLPTFAFCPLGRGFFGRARQRGPFSLAVNRERRARCEALAEKLGARPAQVALAYLRALPFPVFPVVGVTTPGHLDENLRAADLRLDRAQVRWLERGDAE